MIEVLKQALEALIQARKLRFALWRHGCDCRGEHSCNPLQDEYAKQFNDSIIKLEQAIAELESQEPVAWRTFDGEGFYFYCSYEDNETYADVWNKRNPNHKGWVEPLYTHPPQRTWVGLTDEEAQWLYDNCRTPSNLIDMVEAKLKEKNT